MSSCKFVLSIGKAHARYAPSSVKVCITPTQAEKLFGSDAKPKALGCGVFACVFQHKDPDKVVKITHDESDVAGLIAANMEGYGLSKAIPAPKVFDKHALGSRAWWTKYKSPSAYFKPWATTPRAFALELEKLETLPPKEKKLWSRRLGVMKRENDLAKICPKRGDPYCVADVEALQDLRNDLADRGVDWTDMHGGNIGKTIDGLWKVLDLGASKTHLDEDLPVLEGARRKRRKRR